MERTGGAGMDAMHRIALADMKSKRPFLSRRGRTGIAPNRNCFMVTGKSSSAGNEHAEHFAQGLQSKGLRFGSAT
jgi:hypothetical protein